MVLANKSFQHHLHRVELPVSETPHKVDFAEASDGEAFADFVSFESAFGEVLEAVEGGFAGEDALSDGDLVV